MKTSIIGILLLTFGCMASAAPWSIDDDASTISFITTKKVDVAEINHFKRFSGQLTEHGAFTLNIELASVWTNVEIRDSRLKDILFEVGAFPVLELVAVVDMDKLSNIEVGETEVMEIAADIKLHGTMQRKALLVTVAKLSDNRLLVASTQPIIVNAAQYGFTSGIEKLREIAGLSSISQSVPVSFILNLSR
ncbi:YceI family protein [uncultured Shewanella sp.]|uniref:YceI family protein n=1 Tax=Shewanella atlantica TaxID=271099 RepID=UPI00261DCCA1|nr:YceI family protein [uncultured Shewanella sp.]